MTQASRAVLLALAVVPPTAAQDKAPLRWGMDETGGAPYIYDNRQKGFEVELAGYLADKLGRVSTPVNGEWNKLPEMLARQDLDIVLNGYEFSELFRPQASVPYYVYRLTATVRVADESIRSWEDLRPREGGRKKKVGVLTGSAAQRYMQDAFGNAVDLQIFDDVASTFDLVARGQIDVTVQDNPAAAFYVAQDGGKQLRLLSETRAPGYYVILTRPEDQELRARIDDALRAGEQDGTLERIYRRYGIWNEDQERLAYRIRRGWAREAAAGEAAAEGQSRPINWGEAIRLLVQAGGMTVLLAVTAMPLAMLVGLLVAIARLFGPRWLAGLGTIYVEVLRGTPLLLQLWVIYFLLPRVVPGLTFDPIVAGIVGLSINYSASEAENFRAGFLAIPRGQLEAALALGMTQRVAIRRVMLPQAFRIVLPPITNDFIALFKDTAVCSVIAVMELTKQYNVLYNNHRDNILILAALTALLYLLMSYPLSLLARWLERRQGGHR